MISCKRTGRCFSSDELVSELDEDSSSLLVEVGGGEGEGERELEREGLEHSYSELMPDGIRVKLKTLFIFTH